MNGSIGSDGRRSEAELVAQVVAAIRSMSERSPHRDCPLQPQTQPCAMCGASGRAAAFCEQGEAIWDALRRRDLLMFGQTERPVLCKDCCIAELAGHRCAWWGLCWR